MDDILRLFLDFNVVNEEHFLTVIIEELNMSDEYITRLLNSTNMMLNCGFKLYYLKF